jgi:L-lysine 2,3-aminomutase
MNTQVFNVWKQVIPSIKPQIETLDFSIEPLKDEENSPVAGLIHKYPNRVLLITSRVCAIHCQYCFRQNFNYIGHDADSTTRMNTQVFNVWNIFNTLDELCKLLITQTQRVAAT